MNIRLSLLTALVLWSICVTSYAQSSSNELLESKNIDPEKAWVVPLDIASLEQKLSDVKDWSARNSHNATTIELPLFNVGKKSIELYEASTKEGNWTGKYEGIKSYRIANQDGVSGRIAYSSRGLTGLIFHDNQAIFIEPLGNGEYVTYPYKKSQHECGSDMRDFESITDQRDTELTIDGDIKRYRIAIACSGEWSNKRNNDLAVINAEINDYLTVLNALYEREVNITFILAQNNDDLIFFDADTDGIDPNSRLSSAQSTISSNMSSNNYDLGHVFYEIPYTGNGYTASGVASLGVVCNSGSKARGWTGMGGNYNTNQFVDIFGHEVGHQFNATHSFYGTSANCSGFNRSAGEGYEPGSGNSLMSYESSCWASGSCTNQNITPYASSFYFHVNSMHQIHSFAENFANCEAIVSQSNAAPDVSIPDGKHIPKNTPFILEGSATDANGDAITFNWEEYDTDNQSLTCPAGAPNDAANSTTAPLFRSLDPSASGNTRVFPAWSDIVNNNQTMGEILPNVARNIKMRLNARDGNGGVTSEELTLVVADVGPFEVTVANSGTPNYLAGDALTVTWNVNGTDAAPISVSQVDILWSNDGGYTYPITLASAVPNDGSHDITLPNIGTETGRIMVSAVDNYFFDINDVDIKIVSDCNVSVGNIIDNEAIVADAGDQVLNMQLYLGTLASSYMGEVDNEDEISNISCLNQSDNMCITYGNTAHYETFKYRVSASGSYTINDTDGFFAMTNLYENNYDPTNNCNNWLASNSSSNNGSISITNSLTATHSVDNVYELKVGGFNTGYLGTYTLTFSNNVSGNIYLIEEGYNNTYIISNSDGDIVGFDEGPDMSDATIYGNGNYLVKGLAYAGSIDFSAYTGGEYSAFENDINAGTLCGAISSNSKSVQIGNGCPPIITVTNGGDSGAGSLRDAVANACDDTVIEFDNSVTSISLNSPIVVNQDTEIAGIGTDNKIFITGNLTNGIFVVNNGVALSLKNVTLSQGYENMNGGAFYNNGTVTLETSEFEYNYNGTSPQAFSGEGTVIIKNGLSKVK